MHLATPQACYACGAVPSRTVPSYRGCAPGDAVRCGAGSGDVTPFQVYVLQFAGSSADGHDSYRTGPVPILPTYHRPWWEKGFKVTATGCNWLEGRVGDKTSLEDLRTRARGGFESPRSGRASTPRWRRSWWRTAGSKRRWRSRCPRR